jgi:crotonobetainyl-CoA:carnitine CoA-transferase CaiB-like acyl-CoA transferase
VGALDGLHVVDLSWGWAGPMATGQLADHGASVVRVEPPGGDPYRPFVSHAAINRGKRSIVLDLRTPEGRDVVERLIANADVMVTSWQPGVAEGLGLDPARLLAEHPRLVVCSLSGYGAAAVDRDRPGYDSLVSARMGLLSEHQQPGGRPVYLGVPIASIGAALLAVIGIGAALVAREDTGRGRHVETSLVDGALAFMSMFWESLENEPAATGGGSRSAAPSRYRLLVRTFECADGEFVGIHTGAAGSHGRLIEALGLSDRIAPAPPGIQEKKVPMTEDEAVAAFEEIPRVFATRPRAEWLQLLREVDVTAIPLLRPTEAFDSAQVVHNELVVVVDDPVLGPLEQVGMAARFGLTPGAIRGPAPVAGADTEAVLRELGVTPDDVSLLIGGGVAPEASRA